MGVGRLPAHACSNSEKKFMSYNLKGLTGLVVSDHDSNRRMLFNILKVLGIKEPQIAQDVVSGFRMFREAKFDFVLSEIKDGRNDVVALADFIRKDERSPNPMAPIISTVGPATKHYVEAARNAGVNEMIMAPYTVSDIGQMIAYVMTEASKRPQVKTAKYTGPDRRRAQNPAYLGPFRREGDELLRQSVERAQSMQAAAQQAAAPPKQPEWVSESESQDLTKMLLENYLKHHEIVFSKLKFAQEATKHSLDHIRKAYEDVQNSGNVQEFKNFDKMWEDIIQMFVQGGLSEDEIFKIENIITTIPPRHQTALQRADRQGSGLRQAGRIHERRRLQKGQEQGRRASGPAQYHVRHEQGGLPASHHHGYREKTLRIYRDGRAGPAAPGQARAAEGAKNLQIRLARQPDYLTARYRFCAFPLFSRLFPRSCPPGYPQYFTTVLFHRCRKLSAFGKGESYPPLTSRI